MAHKLGQPQTRRLGDLLVAERLITEAQLKQALAEQKGKTEKLGSILARLGFITEEQLIGFLSRQYGIPSITLTNIDVDTETLRLVPAPIARKYEILPVKRIGGMDVPVPFSPVLEDLTVPSEKMVFEAAKALCGKR